MLGVGTTSVRWIMLISYRVTSTWLLALSFLCVSSAAYGQTPSNSASPMGAANFSNTFSWLFGVAVLVLSIGLVGFMFAVARKILQTSSVTSSRGSFEWYIGLTAACIALFGILITGVFVFMTLQINTTAERSAQFAAQSVAAEVARTRADSEIARILEEVLPMRLDNAVRSAVRHVNTLTVLGDYEDAREISIGFPAIQVIEAESRSLFSFSIDSDVEGTYEITAVGRDDFDPEISLFQMINDVPRNIDFDDDSFGDSNSLILRVLGAGQYYVEVREWYGESGTFTLTVRLVESQ